MKRKSIAGMRLTLLVAAAGSLTLRRCFDEIVIGLSPAIPVLGTEPV